MATSSVKNADLRNAEGNEDFVGPTSVFSSVILTIECHVDALYTMSTSGSWQTVPEINNLELRLGVLANSTRCCSRLTVTILVAHS